MPSGASRATSEAFRLPSKQERINGLACDIDDIRHDLFGRVGRQNPTGGYDSGGADSTPVGGFHLSVYRPGLRIGRRRRFHHHWRPDTDRQVLAMLKRDQRHIYRFWYYAAQCLFGAIVLALLTYVCFRLQANSTTVALLYLIVIVVVSLTSRFIPAAFVSIVAYLCLDSFFSAPPDGSAEFLNQRWLEYTGLSMKEGLDWGGKVAVHHEDLARFLDEWGAALVEGRPLETEARLRRAEGEYRWLLIRAVPLRDEAGKIVKWYGASGDIEDRKRAEEALSKSQAELAHVTRVTTMGELAASIAHEVNQPLSAIVNNGSACLRWLNGATLNLDEAREAARRVVRDGNRAGEVITRIRALLRKTDTDKARLDISQTIQEVVRLTRNEAARKGVAIRMELAADLPPVLGDRVQLQQVILNLVMNGY